MLVRRKISSLTVRQLHTSSLALQKSSLNITSKNEDPDIFDEVEFGMGYKANHGGRQWPENPSKIEKRILELPKPDRDSLLPLTSELNFKKTFRRLMSGKQNRTSETQQKQADDSKEWAPMKDVSAGFRLLLDLIRRKKKITWVKKPESQEVEKDPLANALSVETWNEMTEELETMITRIKDLQPGEEITIIGGGISGLSLAYFTALARPDVKIRLLEKQDRFGGYMQSDHIIDSKGGESSTVYEWGPRTLLPSHPGNVIAVQLMEALGLLDKLGGIRKTASVNTKGLLFNGKVMQLPNSASEAARLFSSDFMSSMRFGMLKEVFTKAPKKDIPDESVEAFVSRRFNSVVANRLVSAVMRGIYAGDISELSARSVTRMNKLRTIERTKGISIVGAMFTGVFSSLDQYSKQALPLLSQVILGRSSSYDKSLKKYSMLALDGGIEQLATELAKKLSSFKNVKIEKSTVKSITPKTLGQAQTGTGGSCTITTDNGTIQSSIVVSTLAAHQIGPCLTASPEAQMLTSQIKFTNVAVVDFFFPGQRIGKNWFGYLVPKSETTDEQVLGVIFDSAVRNSAFPIKSDLERGDFEGNDELLTIKEQQLKKQGNGSSVSKEKKSKLDTQSIARYLKYQLDDTATSPEELREEPKEMPKDTTLTVMMGGHLWDSSPLPSEQEVIDRAVRFLESSLGQEIKDYQVGVRFQRESIPQYTVGHSERVHRIHDAVSKAYNNRLFLSGTSFGRGVGIGDCLVDSVTLATRFSPKRKMLFPKFYVNHVMAATHPDLYA